VVSQNKFRDWIRKDISLDILSNLSIVIPNHNEPEVSEVYRLCRYYCPEAQIIVSDDFFGFGKGWAVREGLKKATKDYIVIIDGDMDIRPACIILLKLEAVKFDIVIGKKEIWNLVWHRKIITIFSRWLIKKLFKLPVTDTQTGIKLFPKEAITDFKTDGWMYDVELLYNAHKMGFTIGEVPVYVNSTKSKGILVLIKTFWELIQLRKNYGKV
jgi:glycosyltransferase involved in cell wall biosynthesis